MTVNDTNRNTLYKLKIKKQAENNHHCLLIRYRTYKHNLEKQLLTGKAAPTNCFVFTHSHESRK